MIRKTPFEAQSTNTCAYCHTTETTPEGLLCRKHWDLVPGTLKGCYQDARVDALKAVADNGGLR